MNAVTETSCSAMKYTVVRFKSLKMALKELEPYIRNGRHLSAGRPFKQFGDMRSREMLANWLVCVVVNFDEAAERVTFSSDPIGGDGVIHDDTSGFAWPTEHVFVPNAGHAAVDNIEKLILVKISQKQSKGGSAYASGKNLIVFLDSGGGIWYPKKIARQLPEPLDFDSVWVVGLQAVTTVGEYIYAVTRLDIGVTPAWQVRIALNFEDWLVERIQ
jgi:hypothetical protein